MARAGREPTEQATEPPTPRRLAEAGRRGEVALSRELVGAVALAAGFALCAGLGPAAVARLTGYLAGALAGAPAGGTPFAEAGLRAGRAGLDVAVGLLALPLGLVVLTSLVVGLAQTGGRLARAPLRPDLRRLSSGAALRDLFGPRMLFEVGRGVAGGAAVAAVAWLTVRPLWPRLMQLPRLAHPARGALAAFGATAERLGLRIVLVTLALGVLDAVAARARHRRALLMTRDEVRRERRELEGDDVHRAERRRVHRDRVLAGDGEGDAGGGEAMLADVRRAAVVVARAGAVPIAVALAYERNGPAAPSVLAKRRGAWAASIERAAREAGVPSVDRPALAEALAALAVGDEIPEAHYEEVARVLQSVYAEKSGLE